MSIQLDSDAVMVLIIRLIIITFVVLHLLERFSADRLHTYLIVHDQAPTNQIIPRKEGVLLWLSIGGLLAGACILSAVFNVISGAIILGICSSFFLVPAVKLSMTTIKYNQTTLFISRMGKVKQFPLTELYSVTKQTWHPAKCYRLELRFRTGVSLYFEQINYCGLESMYTLLNNMDSKF